MILLTAWFCLMVWFVPGYMAGKAVLREDPTERGIAVWCFFLGVLGYGFIWWMVPDEMREVHGLPETDRTKPSIINRFFGEVKK